MEKWEFRSLLFDAIAVTLTLIIFLYGPLGDHGFFMISAYLIFVLLLISVGITLYVLLKSIGFNSLSYPFFAILLSGTVLVFFNWFLGGLIALASLYLLFIMRREKTGKSIIFVLIGFSVLAILPPVEAFLSISESFWDFIIIGFSFAIIIYGLLISFKTMNPEEYTGLIALSLSFLILAPAHEALGIRNNGTYGIYDTSIIVLAALVFYLFLMIFLNHESRVERMLHEIQKGYRYIEGEKYKKAEGHFRILRRKYNHPEIRNGLAIALMRQGKFGESEKILKKLIKSSNDEVYLANLGNLYYREGRLKDAMLIYGRILRKNPDSYNALNNLATCYMDRGEYQKAEKLLKRAMKISPEKNYAKINYERLKSLSQEGNP